jgi:two-component system, OmpR family, alkaline phosphatase synthesis response regulator PhoP
MFWPINLETGPNMSKRILLCDDEIHIVRAMEFKLKKGGYEVEITSDGEEAWEAIQIRKPDLLITDCQMPRLTGLELIERLRNNPQTADILVFMLTAKGYELSQELLFNQLRVLRVLAKPFSPRELLQDVNAVMQQETIKV